MKRGSPKRYWEDARAKVDAEGDCRVCGQSYRVEFAHLSGRTYDPVLTLNKQGNWRRLYVRPDSGIPLCGPATDTTTCHGKQHAGTLDLVPYLTNEEAACAVLDLGLERAYWQLRGNRNRPPLIETESEAA